MIVGGQTRARVLIIIDYHQLSLTSDRLSRNAQSDWLHRCRLSIDLKLVNL